MPTFVCKLASVDSKDVAAVGAKAATLGALAQAGFPVPPGICVTTDAFREALGPKRAQLDDAWRDVHFSDQGQLERLAARISEILSDWAMPAGVATALRRALRRLDAGDAPFAVRSSATAEDRADASFAGQYDTVLGVRAEAEIIDAILTCWRSFFSAHALAARAAAGATGGDEAMAVLIQPLVAAECAGVCFSVDPTDPAGERIAINAAWGLGPGVVDGTVPTDTLWVSRKTLRVTDREIVPKHQHVALVPGGLLQRSGVQEERQRAACLPDARAERIAQFAFAAEQRFGHPQDIEWAVADGRIWVLQSRPITTLPAAFRRAPEFQVDWEHAEDARCFWRLDEARPLLPLEADVEELWSLAHHDASLQSGNAFGGGSPGPDRVPVWRCINGRAYVHWAPIPLAPGDRRVRAQAARDLCARLRDNGITRWEHFEPEVAAANKRLSAFEADAANGAALADHLEDAFGAFRRHWTVHWLPGGMGVLDEPFYAAYERASGRSGREARAAADQLLEGEENLLSELIDGLYDLAVTARSVPVVATLVAQRPPNVMYQLVGIRAAAGFCGKLARFLARFGDRVGAGFGSSVTITTPAWRERPELVLGLVAAYLDPAREAPSAARGRIRESCLAQAEALCEACTDDAAVAEFRRWLPYARRLQTDHENHNHHIDQLSYGLLRRAIMAAASHLVAKRTLRSVDAIFWLHRDEIRAALCSPIATPMAELIANRQAEHARLAEFEAPIRLGLPEAELPPRPPLRDELQSRRGPSSAEPGDAASGGSGDGASTLSGRRASPGRARGRARVIPMGTALPQIAPGEILVAQNAGPAWTPIFPALAGVVLDHGAVFMHAGTTAREYGVPAVFNTVDATVRIPDGAWITIDGDAGTVEIEAEPETSPAQDTA